MRQPTRLLLILLSTLVVAAGAFARQDNQRAIKTDYPVTPVTDKVHVIYGPLEESDEKNQGFRNNPGIVLTSEGVVVIDPGATLYAGEMVLKKIRTLTQAPVIAVFDTHHHGDHWLGNDAIKRAYPKATIYAHPTMKAKLEGGEGQRWLDIMNRVTHGASIGTRVVGPDKTVTDGDVVKLGDTRFRIYQTGTAHTDNDIMIEVVEEKVLFLGDVVRGNLGLMEGSSFKGNIAAIDVALKIGAKHFVPGHGPSGGPEVALTYQNYLKTLLATVQALYQQGFTDFEMKPKVGEALRTYKHWSGFDTMLGLHISYAYLEVEAESF